MLWWEFTDFIFWEGFVFLGSWDINYEDLQMFKYIFVPKRRVYLYLKLKNRAINIQDTDQLVCYHNLEPLKVT